VLVLVALFTTLGGVSTASGTATVRFRVPHVPGGRLDSRLAAVARADTAKGARAALASAHANRLAVANGQVRVVVVARKDGSQAASAVRSAGGRVVMRAGRLLEATLAPSLLRSVSRSPAIAEVRSPALVIPQAVDEGVALSGADAWHTAGFDGSGVKVAIIDVGFAGYTSLLGTALPASVATDDRCNGNLATPVANGGSDHGTAVAELVHQMAPGAELDLICIDSEVGLSLAEQDAAASGVQVVTQSLGFFGPDVGRGDGTGGAGTPDAVVAQARADGILWVNASGNYAQKHWLGTFAPDVNDPSLNDFARGGDVPYDQVTIASGEQACAILTWDDWPVTTEDFDLGLFNLTTGDLVASSTNDQSSSLSAPEEDLCYTNPGATDSFGIVVLNYNAVGSPALNLFYTGASPLSYANGYGSVVDPASSPDALAVGAACWTTPTLGEPYSSGGPTIDGRAEPALTAVDSVSTVTYSDSNGTCGGLPGFSGTSAAAAQVAGGAALMLGREPSLGAGGLTATLEARSIAGGSGLLAMGELHPPGSIAMSDQGGTTGVFDGTDYGSLIPHFAQWPVWSADGSRINFDLASDGSNPGGFASVEADGSDLQIVPGSPTGVEEADWSADGSKVAYVSPQYSPAGIWVYDVANGTSIEVLADPAARAPQWSPDGSKIAYITGTTGSDGSSHDDAWVMDANGSNAHALTSLGTVGGQLGWSPDGSKIAFSASYAASVSPGIWLVGADGSNPHQLTADYPQGGLTWSPDGTQIAFLGTSDGHAVLKVVNADGTGDHVLFSAWPNNIPNWLAWTSALDLFNAKPPVLSGTPQVGEALAATAGKWVGTATATFSYQWYRCDSQGTNCAAISGQTADSYTATAADVGSTLRVEVDATDGTHSESAQSAPSGVVLPSPPVPTAIPTITGTAQAGSTLSVSSPGSWSEPVTLSYQWLNCDSEGGECFDIPGATSADYEVTSSDYGATLRVAVDAVAAGGSSYLSSTPSAVVPTPQELLTISKDGNGSGTVSSDPAGIDCGSTCSQSFDYGTNVHLTASPDTGSVFAGWRGGGCAGTSPCTVTLGADTTITATFDRPIQCVVPRVKGKTLKAAKHTLRARHCPVGKITYKASKTVPKGKVISQSPRARKFLRKGAKVSLVVSKGK
jgi:PASTA domain-containing protein/List-Bact-rpt repeat protein/subtilase family protein/predicted actin-binding protein/WD40 repeat protein